MNKIWYEISKTTNGYTIWKYKEQYNTGRGSGGIDKIYTGITKNDCINYAKQNNIKIQSIVKKHKK